MSFGRMGEISDKEPGRFTAEILYQYMEGTMKCPHLNRWIVATCKIEERIYVPSVFQLNEYCKTRGHKKCPFFVTNVRAKKETTDQVSVQGCA